MPRENRKRGKKKYNTTTTTLTQEQPFITSVPNVDAPFGRLNDDLRAYFRSVDLQIRDWQQTDDGDQEVSDAVRIQDKNAFFIAALSEMSDNEKQLATDATCSLILERMLYSMDDFARRVFMDRLAGSYDILARNRFASHVCQTLFTLAADTISRECQNDPKSSDSSMHGQLLTLTQLVLNTCEELLPFFTGLIMDPFGSHVVRALLLLLCPGLALSDPSLPLSAAESHNIIRSRKSFEWKAQQGLIKSVFRKDGGNMVPSEFHEMSHKFVQTLKDNFNENEVRALVADKVASPVLQILLEIEAHQGMASRPDSLLDQVTLGLVSVSICQDRPVTLPEPSDYITSLLRDPTASHLLEIVVSRAPDDVFAVLWSTYFRNHLGRLAHHPVSNFVVAKAIERLTADQLGEALRELHSTWHKSVNTHRLGVLRAAVDRAVAIHSCEQEVVSAVLSAFGMNDANDRNYLVPCVLYVKQIEDYKLLSVSSPRIGKETVKKDATEPKTQGALLLQSLIRITEPQNHIVIDSLRSLSIDEVIALAQHPTSSRILDAYLESSAIPFKAKRHLLLSFIGYYHRLVDDRIGSRIGDRCWAFADVYLKEKIARSLIPHEHFLAASFYGKFFTRNLNLSMLQRQPERWKTMQAERRLAIQGQSADKGSDRSLLALPPPTVKRKRSPKPEIEIEISLDTTLVSKGADHALKLGRPLQATPSGPDDEDEALRVVLSAIRTAPKVEKVKKQKRLS